MWSSTADLAFSAVAAVAGAAVDGIGLNLATGFLSGAGGFTAGAADPTVTNGLTLSMVLAETPARFSSSTELYGRPAMIFLAVADPTPFKASRSFCEALLRSIMACFGLVHYIFHRLGISHRCIQEQGYGHYDPHQCHPRKEHL